MLLFFAIFILALIAFILYNNYDVQVYLHRKSLKTSELQDFISQVNGKFYKKAYFAKNHKLVTDKDHNIYYSRHRLSFSKCYNCVTFKTKDASWELFFSLVKDGAVYSEMMSIRVFPHGNRIRSEGTVEKNFSRVNVLTNSRYLTDLLEEDSSHTYLNWLLHKNDDILLISHNMLHFKTFVESKKLRSKKVMKSLKAIHAIKNIIYKKDVLEY